MWDSLAPTAKHAHDFWDAMRRAWTLLRPFVAPRENRAARHLLFGVAIIALAGGAATAGASYVTRFWFDALQRLNQQQLMLAIGLLASVLVAQAALRFAQTHVLMLAKVRWREKLTNDIGGAFVSGNTPYMTELAGLVSSPDQRIAEDLKKAPTDILDFFFELLGVVINLAVFGIILWQATPTIHAPIGGGVEVRWHIIAFCVAYVWLATWLGHLAGKALTRASRQSEEFEAKLRTQLMRVRENSETIALRRGADFERRSMIGHFTAIISNWGLITKYTARVEALSVFFNGAAGTVVLIGLLPSLLSQAITLGQFLQVSGAATAFVYALAWPLNNYSRLASLRASLDRVGELQLAIAKASALEIVVSVGHRAIGEVSILTGGNQALPMQPVQRSQIDGCMEVADGCIEVSRVVLRSPVGEPINAEPWSLTLRRGQHLVIEGASGVGKTTLMRAMAGVWPWYDGQISISGGSASFVPQSVHVASGPLREVLCYPSGDGADEDVIKWLTLFRLEAMSAKLAEAQDWNRMLSGGERQRVALVAALLRKPDWLFLDEATSALDMETEFAVYTAMREYLPETTLVSIAHRPSVHEFHEAVAKLSKRSVLMTSVRSDAGNRVVGAAV